MGKTSEEELGIEGLSILFSEGEFEQIIKLTKRSVNRKKVPEEVLKIHISSLEQINDDESVIALVDTMFQHNRIPISCYLECMFSVLKAGNYELLDEMMEIVPDDLNDDFMLNELKCEIAIINSDLQSVIELLEDYPELIEDNAVLAAKVAEIYCENGHLERAFEVIEISLLIEESHPFAIEIKAKILERLFENEKSEHKNLTLETARKLFAKNEDVLALDLVRPWMVDSFSLTLEERKFISRLLARSGSKKEYLPFREWFITRITTNHDEFKYLIDTEYTVGDYFGAIELSELYFSEYGQEPVVVDIYVRALGKCGKIGEMQKGMNRLIEHHSLSIDNQRSIVKYLLEFEELDLAVRILGNLLEYDENDIEALRIKSQIAFERGDIKTRVNLERRIMELVGDDISGLASLAAYSFDNGQYSLSFSLLEELSEESELSISLKRLLLKLYIELERINDAIPLIFEILKNAEFDVLNLLYCAKNFLKIGELKHARKIVEDAMEIDDSNDKLMGLKAEIAFRDADWDVALNTNIKLLSNGIINNRTLGRTLFLLFKLNNIAATERTIERATNLLSNTPAGQLIIAKAKFDYQRDSSFRENLEMAMLIPPLDHSTPLLISQTYLANNRLDIAVEYLGKALMKNQNNPQVQRQVNLINELLIDLDVEMDKVRDAISTGKPLFIDALVAMAIVKQSIQYSNPEQMDTEPLAVIQSHTLGLGGAERQVVFCLNALASNDIEGLSGHLMINKIPEENEESYFHLLQNTTDISEYEIGTGLESDDESTAALEPWKNILRHLQNPSTKKRIQNMFLILHELKPKIVHLWQDWGNIYGGMAAIMAGVPKILMSARTLPPEKKGAIQFMRGKSYNSCYKALLEMDSTLLCHNSIAGAKEYAEWLSIDPSEMEVVYNGTDFDYLDELSKDFDVEATRKDLGIPEDAFIVGTIHRFVPEKRPWLWLETAIKFLLGKDQLPIDFKHVNIDDDGNTSFVSKESILSGLKIPDSDSREIHFLIVGDGTLRKGIMNLVEELGISHRFHFPGSTHQVMGWLRVMNCFLSTSSVEGLPNVLIEAQGGNIPVITTDAGGSVETIEPGLTGMCTDADSTSIANLLLQMEVDEEWRNEAQKNSMSLAREKFSLEKMIRKYSEIYGGFA